jgi:hypothetical protein
MQKNQRPDFAVEQFHQQRYSVVDEAHAKIVNKNES